MGRYCVSAILSAVEFMFLTIVSLATVIMVLRVAYCVFHFSIEV